MMFISVFSRFAVLIVFFFFFQAEDGIRDTSVTGVQTCALPISICSDRPIANWAGPKRRSANLSWRSNCRFIKPQSLEQRSRGVAESGRSTVLKRAKIIFPLVTIGLCLAAGPGRTQQAPAKSPKAEHAPEKAPDPWWKHAVIYEIYPRSFQDSNGDGEIGRASCRER